ncbi:MAG: site-specific integrase, partial [Proteobacteria bacterium]
LPHNNIRANAETIRGDLLSFYKDADRKIVRYRSYLRDRAMVKLLLLCPVRLNTVHLLERDMFINGILIIPGSIMKTRNELTIELPSDVTQALNDYLNTRADSNARMFATPEGAPLKKTSIYRTLCRGTERATKIKISSNGFRRLVATYSAREYGRETAGALLVVGPEVLRKHYDLSSQSDLLRAAIKRVSSGVSV